MAVRTRCPCCSKPFSAPEDYLGKKVDCPKCEHRFVLRTAEEVARLEEEEKRHQRQLAEDRHRLALIERELGRRRTPGPAQPYYEKFQTGVAPVRHYDPKASSRYLRVRALSDWLLGAAYLSVMLVMVGAGLTIYLKISQVITAVSVLLLCLVGWALLGAVLYFGFKCLGEITFLLADLGDHQSDEVQLLLDLRDNTDFQSSGEG